MCQKVTTPAKVNDQWDSSLIEDRCYFLFSLSNGISQNLFLFLFLFLPLVRHQRERERENEQVV